jgi:glucosamine--fructose-6-phosphate aminotransferase (isomerizing)
MNPHRFLEDLEAKPASLRALAVSLDNPWRQVPPKKRVIMLGMGSSRYAAQVAARRLRARGIDAVAEYASTEQRPAFPPGETLTIAISATGGSRETLDAVDHDFVALTNDPASELARRATTVVEMHAGVEEGGVACRTFQHTQLLLHALVEHLTGGDTAKTADLARRTAEATEDLLDRRDAWLPAALELLGENACDGIFPIAPAERISSALQSALMFREGPRRAADGCETGDWAHVDVYLTKTLRYAAVFLPGSRYDEQALDWLRQRGSTIVGVGGEVPGAALAVRFRHDDHSGVRLMTETLVSELVAAVLWSRAQPAKIQPAKPQPAGKP